MGELIQGIKEAAIGAMPYLEKAYEKLGLTVDYILMLQVKQAYVIFWSGIFRYMVFFLVAFGIAKLYFYLIKKVKVFIDGQLKSDQEFFNGLSFVGSAVFWMFYSVVCFNYFYSLPSIQELCTLYINPEFWVLQNIMQTLKGLK